MKWNKLKFVERHVIGRDEYRKMTGFDSREEVEEYGRYYEENMYVYFPKLTRIWEENGNWYCIVRTANSSD